MDRINEYRAKAFELLSLTESVNDPERRADMLRFAQMWMSLSKPLPDLRSAYELPPLAPGSESTNSFFRPPAPTRRTLAG